MCFSKDVEPTKVRIELPPDILEDLISEREIEEIHDEEERYQYSRMVQDPTDEFLKEVMQLYDNYDNMDKQE